jgi:hypothetical protein
MAVETWGKYQLDLFPFELEGVGRWAAYLGVHKFDEETQDFVCVMERQRVSDAEFQTEAEAIEEARRAADVLIKSGKL